jgi:hypothetical protein
MSKKSVFFVVLMALLYSSLSYANTTRHIFNNAKKPMEIRVSGSGWFEGHCSGKTCLLQPGQATAIVYQPSSNIFTSAKRTVCFGKPGASNQCYFNQGSPRLHHSGRTPYAALNDPADGDVSILKPQYIHLHNGPYTNKKKFVM